MHIIDRRWNPKGRSLPNRQRFIRRARSYIRDAVRRSLRDRTISDESGDQISIPGHSVNEPTFHHDPKAGKHDHVLPGNKEFTEGDLIQRPPSGGGKGRGKKAGGQGEGEDSFQFTLTRDEFLDIFFEDLELPELIKTQLQEDVSYRPTRAGFAPEGTPANLAVGRTMRNSLARRIALRRPRRESLEPIEAEIAELEARDGLTQGEQDRLAELRQERERIQRKLRAVPYIDPVDVRYRRFEMQPKPTARAVMFCLMDVSGSMDERAKDLAKRFFMLLHLFLKRCYERVDVVFIRHTHRAQEVDEQTFFYSRETGGTVVSTAIDEMRKIVTNRYPPGEWNIYAAQASDGDNIEQDCQRCIQLLHEDVLPLSQYYAYIEIGDPREANLLTDESIGGPLWQAYRSVQRTAERGNFAMKRIFEPGDIYPVFRELFQRRGEKTRRAA